MDTLFFHVSAIIIIATLFGLVARLVKQPPLVGYVLSGILLGPLALGYLGEGQRTLEVRQLGIALLLFLVGMELDWTKARHQLSTTTVIGLIQVLGSFAAGFLVATYVGADALAAMYVGTAVAFSSTIVIVKLLSDSRDINSLHGRMAVGVLLFEDAAAAVSLAVLSGLGASNQLDGVSTLLFLLSKAIVLFALLWMVAHYLLPYLFKRIARSSELLFLSSLAWCFTVAVIARLFDFPVEIGALLAGISLAALPYTLDILNRLRSLRDCTVILLFVILGSEVRLIDDKYLAFGICILVLTLIGKPLITYLIMNARGYKSRTSFMVSLTQGQIGELSLVIVASGLASGYLPESLASGVISTATISLIISAFFLAHRERLYTLIRPMLRLVEKPASKQKKDPIEPLKDHIVIFGYHRMGYHILKKLRQSKHPVVIVDFNPDIVAKLREQGVHCVYGDIQDEDILDAVQASTASMVICTIPHREETIFLIERLKKVKGSHLIIVTSNHIDDALEYYHLGANYVILPHQLGGEHVGDLIMDYERGSLQNLIKQKAEELRLLKTKNHALYYD